MSQQPCCMNKYDGKQQYCNNTPTIFVHHRGGGGPICKPCREEAGMVLKRCVCGAMNTDDNPYCGACERKKKV